MGVVCLAFRELSLHLAVELADYILQILMRVLNGDGYIGDLLQLIAVFSQSLDFADDALDVFVLGCKTDRIVCYRFQVSSSLTTLTFDNLQAVQRDLGEELVLIGVQSGGHGARADAAVRLTNGTASFLDARQDE